MQTYLDGERLITISRSPNSGGNMNFADKDYWLDADRNLTTDEKKAAFLLIRKGQTVTPDLAAKYKLGIQKEKDEKKETKIETEVKVSKSPTANKLKMPGLNKSKK